MFRIQMDFLDIPQQRSRPETFDKNEKMMRLLSAAEEIVGSRSKIKSKFHYF